MVHLQLYRFYDKKGLSLGTALVMCVPIYLFFFEGTIYPIYLEEEISFNIPPLWSGDPLQEMANCETMKSIQETVFKEFLGWMMVTIPAGWCS